ncbi:hypothetical protein GA0070618_3113 [Micromonospora echinospora]|uniref:DUF916 domain-containing protein n=1 Tax=Micromonospora echinospora TaxID=1877 RepID=A0A1C4XJN9_MICEC|nr:hypothetical protein GA0070618_3113 [Micromonospora echinospora]
MLASVAVVAFAVPASPATAFPGTTHRVEDDPTISIRMLDIPAARVKDPRARAYIVDHLKPGTTIHRRVEIQNSSPERQHIELYAAGATVRENVFTAFDGRGGNELSSWVRTEVPDIDLPPGAKRAVKVTISVPESASRGERYAALLAQVTKPPTDGSNIGQIRRVGVRIYLDVGPGGEPPTDFRIDGLTAGRGPGEWPVVTARVHNTGERALDMNGTLTLSRESGTARVGPFSVTTGVTILPGQTGQVSAEVTEPLAPGRWTARLVLTSGTVERETEGKLTFPVPVEATAAEPAGRTGLVLSVGVGAVLAIAGTLLAWHLIRRSRCT